MKTAERLPARVAPVIGASTPLISAKILPSHLERLAIVYVRQSTQKQVLENRESAARQYAFAERAVAFGWPRDRVLVIDEDLGKWDRRREGNRFRQGSEGPEVVAGRWGQGMAQLGAVFLNAE